MARTLANGLTLKQDRFVREYLIDMNGTQAAIRAGYAKRSAQSTSSRLLSNAKVQQALRERREERNAALQVDANWVLEELVELAKVDPADAFEDDGLTLKHLKDMPLALRRAIVSVKNEQITEFVDGEMEPVGTAKELKLRDLLRNIDMIGKHVGVQAWKHQIGTDEPLLVWHNYAGEAGTGGPKGDATE